MGNHYQVVVGNLGTVYEGIIIIRTDKMPKPKKIQPGCEHCDEEHNPDIPCRNAPVVNEYRVRSREVRESWYTVTGTDALDAMRRHTEKLSKRVAVGTFKPELDELIDETGKVTASMRYWSGGKS